MIRHRSPHRLLALFLGASLAAPSLGPAQSAPLPKMPDAGALSAQTDDVQYRRKGVRRKGDAAIAGAILGALAIGAAAVAANQAKIREKRRSRVYSDPYPYSPYGYQPARPRFYNEAPPPPLPQYYGPAPRQYVPPPPTIYEESPVYRGGARRHQGHAPQAYVPPPPGGYGPATGRERPRIYRRSDGELIIDPYAGRLMPTPQRDPNAMTSN